MLCRLSLRITFVFLVLSCAAFAQVFTMPNSPYASMTNSSNSALNLVQTTIVDSNMWLINSANRSPLDTPTGALSKLDLKAPGKARSEFGKGYQLLMKKDLSGAVQHLSAATTIYPSFVAAHNALGTAYLDLKQNDQARAEFAQAVSLDDHLPTSFFNLGCADLALKHYSEAEDDIQKASKIAPLDLQLLTALAYGQYMNRDFPGVVATAHQVHERKHPGAAMVHFYAAAAWEAQGDYTEAQRELDTLLKEDPKSPAAPQAHQMSADMKIEAARPRTSTQHINVSMEVPIDVPRDPEAAARAAHAAENNKTLDAQLSRENAQLSEAEADATCPTCTPSGASAPLLADATPHNVAQPGAPGVGSEGPIFRSSTDEVAVFFAATDHGHSVTDLTMHDVGILDDRKAPAVVTGFRNESELPLRLGLLIDTSDSINARFRFEQGAAASFMQKVVTRQDDLAFVVGFNNSVLMVQDFTGDQKLISRAVNELVPAGGTALWDAVAFAADKLASRPETQPVARILVVISDGEDNSSSATAKQAINHAQRGGVTVYTISTRDIAGKLDDSLVGEHALKALAELTGGAAVTPGTINGLKGGLNDIQQVIRSRYLLSYKPAQFKRDGQYRPIELSVEKDGHKLHIYARKGYYANPAGSDPDQY
jgi:VWFA-related protein